MTTVSPGMPARRLRSGVGVLQTSPPGCVEMRITLMRAFIQIDSAQSVSSRSPNTLQPLVFISRQKSSLFIGISRDQWQAVSRRGTEEATAWRCECGHSQGAWRVAVAPAIFVRIRSRMLTAHGLDAACAAVTAISTRQPGRARPATRTQAREGAQPAGSHAFHTSFMPS